MYELGNYLVNFGIKIEPHVYEVNQLYKYQRPVRELGLVLLYRSGPISFTLFSLSNI